MYSIIITLLQSSTKKNTCMWLGCNVSRVFLICWVSEFSDLKSTLVSPRVLLHSLWTQQQDQLHRTLFFNLVLNTVSFVPERLLHVNELWSHRGLCVCALSGSARARTHTHIRPLLVFHAGLIRWLLNKLTRRSLTFNIWKLIRIVLRSQKICATCTTLYREPLRRGRRAAAEGPKCRCGGAQVPLRRGPSAAAEGPKCRCGGAEEPRRRGRRAAVKEMRTSKR